MKDPRNLHRFTVNDCRLALDVPSGSLVELDAVAWEALDLYGEVDREEAVRRLSPRFGEAEAARAWDELARCEAEGLFFSAPPAVLRSGSGAPEPVEAAGGIPAVLHSLCLNLAHDCNLRCGYCFAGQGAFGGGRGLMSPEVARRAIDFLLRSSGRRRQVEVDFFGGEPLLNQRALRETIEYAEARGREAGKAFRFTLTTNATLLDDETLEYLNQKRVSLVLSLDGRPEVNDRMRPGPGGRGSYDRVLPRIRRAVESRGGRDYYVRGTYTRHNLDFATDVLHLVDQGFQEVSVEPVVGTPSDGYALRQTDLPAVMAEYERLARTYVQRWQDGRPFSFFHFNIDVEQGPCLARRVTGCGAGTEYLAVTPEGELYPCHQFVGRREFMMGNADEGVTRPDLARLFRETTIHQKPLCGDCWARFYCGGGCHANAHLSNGDLRLPYAIGCAVQKKRIECALYIQAATRESLSRLAGD